MGKGAIFTMGILFGVAVVAAFLLALPGNPTHAVMQSSDRAGDILVATGGTNAQVYDVLWVVRKGEEFTHLAAYRIEPNGREMSLLAARNITFDLQIETEFQNKGTLPQKIKEQLDRERENKKKPK